jgi:hypothetical protein
LGRFAVGETGIAAMGKEVYSKEELIAEFSASMLSNYCDLEVDLGNNAAYIASWCKKLKNRGVELLDAINEAGLVIAYLIPKVEEVEVDKIEVATVEKPIDAPVVEKPVQKKVKLVDKVEAKKVINPVQFESGIDYDLIKKVCSSL